MIKTELETLFEEITTHLLQDAKPADYIGHICEQPFFSQAPFDMLLRLKQTEQSPLHHPEGNVWNHTMLVLNEAAKLKGESSDKKAFMWAALLHDIGKPDTTQVRRGRITSYDHDKAGSVLAEQFLRQLTEDRDFIHKTSGLVRWHMQILFVVNNLPFADVKSMKRRVNIRDVALLGLCDRLGRMHADADKELKTIETFLDKVKESSQRI